MSKGEANLPMEHVVGIDLGGTRIKGAIFASETGELLARKTVPTLDGETVEDVPAFLHQARGLLGDLEKEAAVRAGRIGISSPGMTNQESTRIDFMPGRLPGLEGLDWGEALGKNRPPAAGPVRVVNDAHAALLGEIWQGGAAGLQDVVLLTLGTGVGGAVVSGGNLLRGHLGRAGHLGHLSLNFRGEGDICGTPGSLEDLVGNHNVFARSDGRFDSTRALVDAVEKGDPDAREVWDESMRALAAGIASFINLFDPEAVLLGGGIAEAWEAIHPRLEHWLAEFEWRPGGHRVELRRARLGEWAGTYGAAWFSLEAGRIS